MWPYHKFIFYVFHIKRLKNIRYELNILWHVLVILYTKRIRIRLRIITISTLIYATHRLCHSYYVQWRSQLDDSVPSRLLPSLALGTRLQSRYANTAMFINYQQFIIYETCLQNIMFINYETVEF